MASIHGDSSPDRKRKKCTRKGPHDITKKMAVVLREWIVFKNKETNEVFMPTTITMSNEINPDPGLRQEISFTKSMTPEAIKEVLKSAFAILANTERFFCAKAVQKEKLDFFGERRIWSGEVLNREIKGHSVLYIYCEEENSDQHPSLSTQVENMQISRNESSSEDRSDSGFETCTTPRDTSRNRDSLLSITNTTGSPEPDEYETNNDFEINEDIKEAYSRYPGAEKLNWPINPHELPLIDHNLRSEENGQDTLSRNSQNNAEVEETNQDVAQEISHPQVEGDEPNHIVEQEQFDHGSESEETMQDTLSRNSQNNAEVEETNQDVAQEISHPQVEGDEPNHIFEQEQFDHGSESEETMQDTLSRNFQSNAGVEETSQDVAQEISHPQVEGDEPNHIVEQEQSHPQMDVEEPNQNVEQEQLVQKICPSSGPLEGGTDFLISLKEELPEHIQFGFAYFGNELVPLKKLNKLTLEGTTPGTHL